MRRFVSEQLDGGFFVENLRFVQNVIDWVSLDNDMLSIRARGVTSRRLERIGRGTEIAVEALSYAVPIVSLFAFGGWLHWRRRQTVPLSAGDAGNSVAAAGISRGEV